MILLSLALATEVFATVDGVPITDADVAALLDRLPADARAQLGDDPTPLVEQLIAAEILYRAGLAAGVEQTPEGRAAVTAATRQALAQVQLDREVAKRVTGEQERAFYDANSTRFQRPQARASHVLVANESVAREIAAGLKARGDFAEAARNNSLDSGSAAGGGDVGWFARTEMVKPFADAVFGAEAGAIVGPVQTEYGWHVIRVDAFRDTIPFEDAREEIREVLRNRVATEYIDGLEAAARVVRHGGQPTWTPVAAGPEPPADAPRSGSPGAPLRLVVFVDLQCPHCAEMSEVTHGLASTRPDLEVVYRHYPINRACNPNVTATGHSVACDAAKAAICNPDAFPALIRRNATLDLPAIQEIAGKRAARCVGTAETTARLTLDIDAGRALGVDGTPAVFLVRDGQWMQFHGEPRRLAEALESVP